VDVAPSFSSVIGYQRRDDLTATLTRLVELSALPLAAVESDFAVDSSGFGTPNKRTWFSTKHGRMMESRIWRKCHLMAGVNTHIVTAVEMSGPDSNDSPHLPELARTTAKGFTLRDVSADKGYSSKANADAIEQLGATPFIAFKANAVEPPAGSAWARMYHMFAYNKDEYLTRYHRRSNVETVFSMIKAKFGDSLLGKTEVAQDNEVLCKVLAHNLCCLVHAFHELGIDADLAPKAPRHLRAVE
jgi:transposase